MKFVLKVQYKNTVYKKRIIHTHTQKYQTRKSTICIKILILLKFCHLYPFSARGGNTAPTDAQSPNAIRIALKYWRSEYRGLVCVFYSGTTQHRSFGPTAYLT